MDYVISGEDMVDQQLALLACDGGQLCQSHPSPESIRRITAQKITAALHDVCSELNVPIGNEDIYVDPKNASVIVFNMPETDMTAIRAIFSEIGLAINITQLCESTPARSMRSTRIRNGVVHFYENQWEEALDALFPENDD